ncbi:MAG: hypothetical protein DMG01_21090 [Acidobacteria bacterium]|nr:MAG: hypothetical protein DMG01_21090 [Acidobacteriota bacterium]
MLRLDCVVRHFAHMNSAKCCQNNPRNAQAAAVLFENCRPFIAKELELLQPDIIVSDVIRRNELQVWFIAEHVVEMPLAHV